MRHSKGSKGSPHTAAEVWSNSRREWRFAWFAAPTHGRRVPYTALWSALDDDDDDDDDDDGDDDDLDLDLEW